ncbi:UDP-N-acetylmuramoylalanine--D-glutamate ligase MurD [Poriferisphaera corsica]|uniref:UDP-N-acetylmuramoylalanine--D-glutamate ligase n=1 Tax=Poriferisphaera corsica TaxID=2528020 RepID=A0A517YXH1_9BACT|nr:UDP-N-acetylmuramoyl-L-alanine--D-glutamate ligase [Poriferisphaera corsica]QDU34922.1 UDP-N-acetylmuramoylalanine--D-glutamate ligase MurD [Poriferisphaera corsica]
MSRHFFCAHVEVDGDEEGDGEWYAVVMEYAGKKVLVMGLGRFGGGVGVSRWLVERGADVMVTDMGREEDLQKSLMALKGLEIAYRLGEHNVSDFTKADMVVVNPAVKREGNRYLRAAEAGGVELTSEIEILLEALPRHDRVIGVTGTAGKSTVCAMLGEAMQAKGDCVWVGGNIGGSLLGCLDEIGEDDWVVLELSSFMLAGMQGKEHEWGGQRVAVVTNFSENHLDWHGCVDAYRDAKRVLLDGVCEGGVVVMGKGVGDAGFEMRAGVRCVEVGDGGGLVMALPGEHHAMNGAIVKTVCEELGVWCDEARRRVEGFGGLPHRMQYVGTLTCRQEQGEAESKAGVARVYNDSKCTTVGGALMGMKSFEKGRVHLVCGGYDKGDDYGALGQEAARWCSEVYAIGDVAERIVSGANGVAEGCEVKDWGEMEQAALAIKSHVRDGDVVLLSPGCASWDQYLNYEERGEAFIRLMGL